MLNFSIPIGFLGSLPFSLSLTMMERTYPAGAEILHAGTDEELCAETTA